MRSISIGFVCLVMAVGITRETQASLELAFERITDNSSTDIASQLGLAVYGSADVLPFSNVGTLTTTQVLFVLENSAQVKSSVSEIYVDDRGVLKKLVQVFNTNDNKPWGLKDLSNHRLAGLTKFLPDSSDNKISPGNLPGGQDLTPAFEADRAFSAQADGNPRYGLNRATERVAMLFEVKTYDGLTGLNAVAAAFKSGDLRVGLHVRSIGPCEDSDSFVTSGTGGGNEITPEPASIAIWTMVAGTCGLVRIARRRRSEGRRI